MKYTPLISILLISMMLCSVCYGQANYRTTIDTQNYRPTTKAASLVILNRIDSANIKELKGIISFTGGIKQSFDGLIEVWYLLCRQMGKSEKLAYLETLGKIAAEVENLAKKLLKP